MQSSTSTGRRTIDVKLSAPIEWHEKTITMVQIREPSAAMFFETGAPQIVVHSVGGAASFVDVPAVLTAYVAKCIDVEQADVFLRLLPLSDGRAIKAALLSFFQEQAEATSS